MTGPNAASEAAKALNRARWGSQVVQRAVSVVVERQAELDEPMLDSLRAVTGERKADGDE